MPSAVGDARGAAPRVPRRASAPPPATSRTSTRSRAAPSSGRCSASWPQFETGFAGAIMVDAGAHTPGEHARGPGLRREPGRHRPRDAARVRRSRRDRPARGRGAAWSSASISAWAAPSSIRRCRTPAGAQPDALSLAAQAVEAGVATPAAAGSGARRDRLRRGSRAARGAAEAVSRAPAAGRGRRAGPAGPGPDAGCGLRRRAGGERHSRRHDHRRGPGRPRRGAGRRSVAERLPVGGRLAVVLLDLELQQRQVACSRSGSSSSRTLVPRYCASISAVLFWIGSRAQSRRGKT